MSVQQSVSVVIKFLNKTFVSLPRKIESGNRFRMLL